MNVQEITLTFQNKTFKAKCGETIKDVLLKNGESPHADGSQFFHCPSLGTCGTCAMRLEGKVSAMSRIEKWRLNFPPHKKENGLRLACQTKLLGDTTVTRLQGFWGNLEQD